MDDTAIAERPPDRKVRDPEGFERYIPPREVAAPQPIPVDIEGVSREREGVAWEYTYSRFGRAHGPHTILAPSLPAAKDEIRKRHNLPDYRGIRICRAA